MRLGSGRRLSTTVAALASVVMGVACGGGGGSDDGPSSATAGGPRSASTETDGIGTSAPSSPVSAETTSVPSTASTAVPPVQTTVAVPPGRDSPAFEGDFPDPYVLYVDGMYYAYATQGSYGNVQLVKSENLVDWELLPLGALPEIPSWAAPYSVWAPAVARLGDGFVLYYSVLEESSGLHCVSVAVSRSPEGPFVDPGTEPLVCPRDLGGAIDASPITDRAGDPWLLWKNDGVSNGTPSAVYVQRLSADGLAVVGAPVKLIGTDQAWESPHVEAPSMFDAGDRYLLIYSGNWWNTAEYGVGVAICESVAGPCTKPLDGPLLTGRADAAGPGGAEFFISAAGDPWIAYHAWLGGVAGYPGRRALWLEPVDVSGEIPVLSG